MGKIEEPWEPFDIQVTIEGKVLKFLVVPDQQEPMYELFDGYTSVGTVWKDSGKQGDVWCGEGLVVKELLGQIGEQMDDFLKNRPV